MPRTDEQVAQDIDYILQQALNMPTLLDEVALIRTSLRVYVEGMSAENSVAWAAGQLAKSLSKITST